MRRSSLSAVVLLAVLAVAAWGAGRAQAFVYWGSGNTITRAYNDGSDPSGNFVTGGNGVLGVAVDGRHVYWANAGSGTIGRANLDGTGVDQSFISGLNSIRDVVVSGQYIY